MARREARPRVAPRPLIWYFKLFFGARATPQARIALLEEFARRAEATLTEYRAVERRIAGREEDFYGYLTLKYALARGEASLRWARETLDELRRRDG